MTSLRSARRLAIRSNDLIFNFASPSTIANSPYQQGQGDLVKEFVAACQKYGLAVGLYHTAGFDAHEALKDYEGEINAPLEWMSTWGQSVSAAFRAGGAEKRESFKHTQVA